MNPDYGFRYSCSYLACGGTDRYLCSAAANCDGTILQVCDSSLAYFLRQATPDVRASRQTIIALRLWPGRISRREVERSARRLKGVEHGMVHETVRRIPREWDVKQDAREALVRLICGRARYVADTIVDRLRPHFRRRQSALWDEEEER